MPMFLQLYKSLPQGLRICNPVNISKVSFEMCFVFKTLRALRARKLGFLSALKAQVEYEAPLVLISSRTTVTGKNIT